ncbi:PRC-barrel domain-containing protein [Actinomadura verrucosospora]|uniref:PRC-barrel domain-containing protein n=1 Tax=Actinomadura verrucosospora TaxID=46165 RepID=A0A7D3VVH2_ACTVE|nr:PRC-barrel domain-containing protein [Actinomadura verrucosospora]
MFNVQTQTQVRELMGMSVTDTHGTKVGTVKQVYLNDDSGAPEWVTVHTGWFGMRESFVPLSGARKAQDALQVPYDKETIKGAPNVDADEHLSHAQIVDLYRHYGVRPPSGRRTEGGEGTAEADADRRTGTGTGRGTDMGKAGEQAKGADKGADQGTTGAQGRAPSGMAGTSGAAGTAGAAGMAVHPERGKGGEPLPAQPGAPTREITRSEERLRIDTERHEAGRVHVRKWVETEMVERTIPVSHEEIKIDREPITDGRPDMKINVTEDDVEIILYEERPVVAKETVPVERVRIRTEQVQDEQTVRGELRKERVEVTRDDGPAGEHGGRGEGGGRHRG